MMAGRKTKCTASVVADMCKELADPLCTLRAACAAVGIHHTIYYDWQKRAESGEEPYASLVPEIQRARSAQGKSILREGDERAADGNRAGVSWAQWKAETLHPTEFGRAQRIEHTGKDGGPIETSSATAEDREAARKALNAMAEGDRGEGGDDDAR